MQEYIIMAKCVQEHVMRDLAQSEYVKSSYGVSGLVVNEYCVKTSSFTDTAQ